MRYIKIKLLLLHISETEFISKYTGYKKFNDDTQSKSVQWQIWIVYI